MHIYTQCILVIFYQEKNKNARNKNGYLGILNNNCQLFGSKKISVEIRQKYIQRFCSDH